MEKKFNLLIKEDNEIIKAFIDDVAGQIVSIDKLCIKLKNNPTDEDAISKIFGAVHTIKGSSGYVQPRFLHDFAHAFEETLIDALNSRTVTPQTVELFIKGNQTLRVLLDEFRTDHHNDQDIPQIVSLESVLKPLLHNARYTATALQKEVDCCVEGDGIVVDSLIAKQLSTSLLHLIRNSLVHGLEGPAQRALVGKPRKGKLSLRFSEDDELLTVEIQDDGAGINTEGIRQKVIEKGICTAIETQKMSVKDLEDVIFKSGFSTAKVVSEFSGRGIGMKVALDAVNSMEGKIHVKSTEGVGTVFKLEIPHKRTVEKVIKRDQIA